ncbi:MAG: hypothetical protein C0596_18210 [Marinilabiliales bacterium]|nr:MAG: hypothetical protein C0596_18210 [Marinilabiliales bacterium]
MKLIKIYKALIFATLTIVLVSCKEEVSKDYREEYIGNFYFKVISNSWTMESSHNDTSYYHGYIRKFETADLDADMYYEDDDSTQNPDSSITIKFADYRVITTLVENN